MRDKWLYPRLWNIVVKGSIGSHSTNKDNGRVQPDLGFAGEVVRIICGSIKLLPGRETMAQMGSKKRMWRKGISSLRQSD